MFKEAGKGFLLSMCTQYTHAMNTCNIHMPENIAGAYLLDRSCSTLMQMRTVKLSPTVFCYLFCNPSLFHREYVHNAGGFARMGT